MTDSAGKAWRCSVCGYVHRGSQPPDWCPVCGAAKADFEAYVEPAAATAAAVGQWRCLNCGYIHVGPEPPDECPVCGAPKDRFEALADQAAADQHAAGPKNVVVVGAGIAGLSAVEALRQACPRARITLVSKEGRLPYYRLNLTRYLAGEITADDLPIHPQSWYDENGIDLQADSEAAAILLDEQAVELRDGTRLPFDKLILTVGAHPFIPPLAGAHREGVTSLRTAEDAESILSQLRPDIECVCIGGGLLGLETAGALARRGARVTLLEGHAWLMPRQLNRRAGELLAKNVREMGITLLTEARTKEIVGDERAGGVLLEDGRTVPAELVVIATGVRPNSYLARRAGLEVNTGVVVDNHLVSSHPAVLAAGDVAEHHGTLYGAWSPAQFQGSIAGRNAAGLTAEFGGIPRSNTLKVLGLDLLSIGQFLPEDGSFNVLEDEPDGGYRCLVFHDGHLVGAILLGDASAGTAVKKAIESSRDLSGLLQQRPGVAEAVEQLHT